MKEQVGESAQYQGQSVPLSGRRDEITEPDTAPIAPAMVQDANGDSHAGRLVTQRGMGTVLLRWTVPGKERHAGNKLCVTAVESC
jgi:hypothetical protein